MQAASSRSSAGQGTAPALCHTSPLHQGWQPRSLVLRSRNHQRTKRLPRTEIFNKQSSCFCYCTKPQVMQERLGKALPSLLKGTSASQGAQVKGCCLPFHILFPEQMAEEEGLDKSQLKQILNFVHSLSFWKTLPGPTSHLVSRKNNCLRLWSRAQSKCCLRVLLPFTAFPAQQSCSQTHRWLWRPKNCLLTIC